MIDWDCYLDPPSFEIDWEVYEEVEIDGKYYLIEKETEIDTSFVEEEDEEIRHLIQSEPKTERFIYYEKHSNSRD